jgi:DNA-binding XRE family transcriptional regulator
LKKVGSEFHNLKRKAELAEQECRLRAIRAINLGYNKKDLADAMGVDSRTITKWIK